MRRSMEEGVNSRFVTGDRLEAVLKVSFYDFWRRACLTVRTGNALLARVRRDGIHGRSPHAARP